MSGASNLLVEMNLEANTPARDELLQQQHSRDLQKQHETQGGIIHEDVGSAPRPQHMVSKQLSRGVLAPASPSATGSAGDAMDVSG